MANSILDKYGIKELTDVTFYELDARGSPIRPVLYLDTTKIATIELSSEEIFAQGGRGNVRYIAWDSNKDITFSLEDALFSMKSLSILMGSPNIQQFISNFNVNSSIISRTEQFVASNNATITDIEHYGWQAFFIDASHHSYQKLNPIFYDDSGHIVTTFSAGQKYFCSFGLTGSGAIIEISARSFPGTYCLVGNALVKELHGNPNQERFCQIMIPRVKISSNNVMTFEGDGEPAVFNFEIKALRSANNIMLQMINTNMAEDRTRAVVGRAIVGISIVGR